MTTPLVDFLVTDLLNDLERFQHRMQSQRTRVEAVAAHQREVDEQIAARKRELEGLHQEVGAAHRELEGLHSELKKLQGVVSEERQAREVVA
jgi:predicted  nucleic acid-binding Zn-ribbon protein